MKINKNILLTMKKLNLDQYKILKLEILYHTNKIEGSTFSMEQLTSLIDKGKVVGEHSLDDVIETSNSSRLFDFIVDTVEEPITLKYMRECHQILKSNTSHSIIGECGKFKSIHNTILGANIEVSEPYEVEEKLSELIEEYGNKKLTQNDIVDFHIKFEKIHPFLDGNGRVGRMLMFKQSIINNQEIVIVDESYKERYCKSLNDKKEAYIVFKDIIDYTEKRLVNLKELIDKLSTNEKMIELSTKKKGAEKER